MRSLMLPVVLVALAACSGSGDEATDDSGMEDEVLEIAGTWTDPFGTQHEIDEVSWTQTFAGYPPYVFHVASWDNAGGWVIAHNDAANGYSADLWSRFDWTWSEGELLYCQSAFDAMTEQDAEAAPGADPSDLDAGCGGFPWTALLP